jgi:hypothetical protein
MSDDKEKLKLVGLDPAKDFQEAAALKVALLQCKYQKN